MGYEVYDLIPAADPVLIGLLTAAGCCFLFWIGDTIYSWFLDKK